jgi:TP901 family phage tail tape measure protein
LANIHSTITYNANLSAAQAQIKALTAQIGTLTAAFNTLDKSALTAQRSLAATFAAGVGQTGGFTTSTVKATSAVETFGKQLAANRLTMREYFREAITGYTRQNSMMRRLAEQQVRYQQSIAVPVGGGQAMMMTPQSINLASNAAALASQRFAVFNQLMNSGATAMLNWGKNTQWAGRQLMVGFTVPLMLFTAVASKQFRELDKELTRFQKVYGADLGNAISDSTERMREQVKQLAYDISSTYGVAAKDTAALAADIAATGREGEELISSVQQTTRLAVLGEVDRQEAMKATLSLQSAFRMNTNELAESINFLNAVENQTSATLEDLATAIPKVGPVVRSLGGDVKDLATLLVAMREGGIPAAEAANALKSGLSALINPTKQASDVARQFGIDLVGIVEANKGQLMPTIYAMQEALGGLDSFGRSRVIEQIFGRYQFARITALFDNIGRAGSQTQSVVELASKSSAELAKVANDELRTLTESTAMRFQRTMEDLKNAIMPIGQTLTETLIPIFEFIGSGMKTLTSFFQSLPGPVKDFAKYGVAIAALAGPIIMMVGLFGNLIANGIKFGMMMTRLGARIAGVRIEKFELLNQDVMAAKLGVDGLTKSFDTQEVALRRLTGVLSSYEQSLRRLTTANPALFIPGALPAARGQVPIRRQAGSTRPEFVPGSGRGDKIPAMLEPGEFIVNRSATEKYAPVLMAMNRGNLPGFQEGGSPDNRHRQAALKSDVFVLRGLGANISNPAGLAGIMSISAKSIADVSTLYVKEIAAAAGTTVSAINREVSAWKQQNAPLLKQFNKDLAVAIRTNNLPMQQELIRKINDKFIADMRASGGPVSQFAAQAKIMFPELAQDLLQTQSIIEKTKLNLNNAEDATEFYAKNMEKTALLSRMATPGPYKAPAVAAAGVLPMLSGATPAAYMSKYGIPAQFLDPRIRGTGGEASSYGIRSAAGRLALLRAGSSAEHVSKTVVQIETYGEQVAERLTKAMADGQAKGARKAIRPGSPSRAAVEQFDPLGFSLGQGAIAGLTKGYKSAVAGKQIFSGPVGGTGIESISNAQKIVQADRAIIKLKDMQLKHTADRVRAEVELVALSRRYASGEINLIQFLEQKRQIELQQKDAAEKELRIQNLINQKKQAIADADQAQLRAEQEEAKAAARRAAAAASPMFGMGMAGSMGYFRGGASPYAISTARPSRFGNMTLEERKQLAAARREYYLLQRGASTGTGPNVAIAGARDQAQGGMRGMGAMNAVFALSMVTSSLSMMSGASQEAAAKLSLFTTALMMASSVMMMRGSMGGGMTSNFLGMGSLANQAGAANLRRGGMAGATAAQAGQLRALGYGKELGKLSGALSVLSGPVGIAAAAAVTGVAGAYLLVQNAADEARRRSVAAFEDPVKSAEYFGETVADVNQQMKDLNANMTEEQVEGIDQALRDAVKTDYADLIEKIRYGSARAGARELSLVFNKMIASGMSEENAVAAVKAIAIESGQAGGAAFAEAYTNGLLKAKTPQDVANNLAAQFDPELMTRNAEEIQKAIESFDLGPMADMAGNTAELLDNTFGDILLGVNSFASNINLSMQGLRFVKNFLPEGARDNAFVTAFDQLFNKDEAAATIDVAANYSRGMEQLMANLAENMDVSSNQIIGVVETLFSTFKEAPTESMAAFDKIAETALAFDNVEFDPVPMQDFLNTLDPLAAITLSPLIQDNEELALQIMKAVAAGMSLQEILDAIAGERLDIEIDIKVRTQELEVALNELKTNYSDAVSGALGDDVEALDKRISNLTDRIEDLNKKKEKSLEKMQEGFDAEQKMREDSVEGLEDELDEKRELFDEEMDALDKRQEKVEESADAYIESLEKTQKSESFYSQQRKTAFSALEKLASGDIFGFLQEREQMSSDAQEFSYDQMISDIEERRDFELDVIDEIREKRQEEQDEYEKNMQDKIDSIRDLMEIEQEAHEQAMEDEEKRFNTKIRNTKEELREKRTQREELQDIIDDATNGEITSAQELARRLPPEQAKQYIQKQKEIIKNVFLLEYQKDLEEGGTPESAKARAARVAMPLYNMLSGARDQGALSADQLISQLSITGTDLTGQYYGSTTGGNTGRNTPRTTSSGTSGPGFDVTRYDRNYPQTRVGSDGITYIWNGNRYVPQYANGGKVTGPGGPKSDVIPAYLSNGEYVIQASSVSKYGKDMMDNINAGKFAGGGPISTSTAAAQAKSTYRGALPGPMMLYAGGYISADRAETAASNNRYAKAKTQYSGGTPTYSGGYTNANSQAYSNIYGQPKRKLRPERNPYTRGGYMRPTGSSAGSGFSLMYKGISGAIEKDGLWSTLGSMASAIAADPASLIPFYGMSSIDTSTQEGRDMLSAAALMEILGVIPGVGLGFKGTSLLGRSAARTAAKTAITDISTPMPFGLPRQGPAAAGPWLYRNPPTPFGPGSKPLDIVLESDPLQFSLGMGIQRNVPGPISVPKAQVGRTKSARRQRLLAPAGGKPDALILDFVRRYVPEEQLDEYFDIPEGGQGGVSPGGFVVGKDGVRRYIKSNSLGSPAATYSEALVARIYKSLGIDIPEVDLLNIGQKQRMYDPGNERYYIDPNYFRPEELVLASKIIPNIKDANKFYDAPGLDKLTAKQANTSLESAMRIALSEEGGIGRAVDIWLGLTDTKSSNYGVRFDPNAPIGTNSVISPVRIDVGGNALANAWGSPVPFDPSRPLGGTSPSHGFAPLSGPQMVAQTNKLWNIIQKDFGGVGGVVDPITEMFARTAPLYKPRDPNFIKTVLEARLAALLDDPKHFGYAYGGLVQKFAEGGLVESINKFFPSGGHQFYSGWNKYNSWSKGKPGLIMMHHTALQPGVSQQAELDAFAKDWKGKPVVQSWIGKGGVAHTLAAGNTGYGAGDGTTKYMKGETAAAKEIIDVAGHPNSVSWQMEVSSAGKTQDFTSGQFDAIARMTAAIRDWAGWPGFEGRIINHKDWAGYRTDGTARNDTLYPISTFVNNANKIWEENGGSTSGENGGSNSNGNKGGKGAGGKNNKGIEETLAKPLRGLYGPLSLLSDSISKGKEGGGKTKPSPDGTYETPQGNNPDGVLAVEFAKKQLGEPYVYNGDGPDQWDCSGLTAAAYNVGVPDGYKKYSLISYSTDQANRLNIVSRRVSGTPGDGSAPEIPNNFGIGDILYFTNTGLGASGKHVSMYAGNGQIIEAGDPVQINPLNSLWNRKYFTFGGPPIPKYAAGGFISGPGGPRSDMIPAMLSNGEYVVKASSVAKYGKGFMDQINSGSLNPSQGSSIQPARFASGGMVGSAPMPAFSMPEMADTSVGVNNTTYGGNSSSTRNSTKVKVVINGAGGKGANAIANKVVSMINSANNRRNHSRSI